MSTVKSEYLNVLQERGFFNQCTDVEALDKALCEGTVTAYIGFDATAKSLHVGSLMPIMLLRWLQKTGHKPVILMGGGTTKVGDPSGKDEARKLLTDDDINANIAGIKQVFEKFIDFDKAEMVNNNDWLSSINYIDFLRDYGPHFTINRMLTFDSVKTRLEREQPLTFLEFNYMLLQAYDFMELNKRYGCTLQMGASDQWGNIINGVELTRRVSHKEVFGLTCPLLLNAEGKKMGKTVSGAVWLNEDMLSSYDYYQFFRNTADADVKKMLSYFTEIPMDEVNRLSALKGQEINEAKKILAFEATKMCHGEENATAAAETARKTFEEGIAAEGLPTVTLARSALAEGMPAFALFKESGLVQSGGEARRLIAGGGARINDNKVSSDQQMVSLNDLTADGHIKLSAGKKKHILVMVE